MHHCPFPLVAEDDHSSIQSALGQLGLIADGEFVQSATRAGEGNMNLVLRVTTNRRVTILKQSRPWVEKYPDIAAPADRILAEIDFYHRVSDSPAVSSAMPEVLASDEQNHLIAMEDLGDASDYSDLYASRDFAALPIAEATAWLAELHSIPIASEHTASIGNLALRRLNHAHIFVIPLQSPSAIPLDDVCPGLEELATEVRGIDSIQQSAVELGDLYMGTGSLLLHGDFYPGSWLRTDAGLRVIDPEFTFAGPAEFDLGVLIAHRILVGGSQDSVEFVMNEYRKARSVDLDRSILCGFAGIEIIRRLIGVAQLPLKASLQQRREMIEIAVGLI